MDNVSTMGQRSERIEHAMQLSEAAEGQRKKSEALPARANAAVERARRLRERTMGASFARNSRTDSIRS